MVQGWKRDVHDALELAKSAEQAGKPDAQVKALAEAVRKLCGALDDVAGKAGLAPVDGPVSDPATQDREPATSGTTIAARIILALLTFGAIWLLASLLT